MGENPLLEKFRKELLKRGPASIKGIGQYFRQIDDDGSRTLKLDELQKGIIDHNISLTKSESYELFKLFDKDNSGTIDYEEFLISVRVRNIYF